jgi:hypothetical protein
MEEINGGIRKIRMTRHSQINIKARKGKSILNQVDGLADNYSSASPYNFALNNPVSQNDPTGLWMNPALLNSIMSSISSLVAQIKLADNSGGSKSAG